MRNISFALTTPQFLDGSKTVTRRKGWEFLKPGDRLMAVEKGMGLKKGETVKRLGEIEVVSVRRERLSAITYEDCRREGFPNFLPADFIAFYCSHNGGEREQEVTRIEFRRVGEEREDG